jgi:lysophospholipase L1-like esterase
MSELGKRHVGRGLLWVLGVGLGLALTCNWYLIEASKGYYNQTNAVRLDPAGLKFYARSQLPKGDRPILVLLGDSRALMWSRPERLTDYEVVNRGVGDQTTAQILLRIDADVTRLKPSVIVLEAGVNDLKAISEFPEKRAEITSDCEANLRRIVARCRETGATVVLVSIFAIGDVAWWRLPFWSDKVAAAVREVNAFLTSIAGDKVVYLDANPILNDDRGKIKKPYQYDFLHLSPVGYAALNQELVSLVRRLPR